MQVVIDTLEQDYERVVHGSRIPVARMRNAIRNGIILPERHGRLIDDDAFIKTMKDASKRNKYRELLTNDCITVDDVFNAVIESLQNEGLAKGDAPTIIEADRGTE